MREQFNRRKFIRTSTMASLGLGIANSLPSRAVQQEIRSTAAGKRIGIIGLDTSHSTAFTAALNGNKDEPAYAGFKIVAAYPKGSETIKSSYERIPAYTEEVKKAGVEIVQSVPELLQRCDFILLETNDGHPHLAQAIQVMKAGKTLFIDKPVAASLADAINIYEAAKHFKVPVFSASSLRYATGVQDAASGLSAGKILGADTFSPAPFESSHPDFFWYGIHGIEILLTVMGSGCNQVSRVFTENADLVTGVWKDGRIGSFRGNRKGPNEYGAMAFGEKAVIRMGSYSGYEALLKEIIKFFETGIPPVSAAETLEIYAFMEAADESRRQGGIAVTLDAVMKKAHAQRKNNQW